jgi:hypothetical protein
VRLRPVVLSGWEHTPLLSTNWGDRDHDNLVKLDTAVQDYNHNQECVTVIYSGVCVSQ